MNIEQLTEEQKQKFRSASSTDELFALVQEEGIELSDEQLEQISGGSKWSDGTGSYVYCPFCRHEISTTDYVGSSFTVFCDNCNSSFNVTRD